MAELLAAWLLYPVVALLVCAGLGLLVERAAGSGAMASPPGETRRLPGVLVLPVGMAGVVAVSQLFTYLDATAELTLPALVALALAGLLPRALRGALRGVRAAVRRVDRWALAAFLATLGVYAAPAVLTGGATFLGYTILGDTSIHLIGADALLRLGRDFDALAPSSYEYSLVAYYGANGYPSGGPTAAGALTSLVHVDVAWTFQTFLSLLSALMGLCLYSLAEPLVASRPQRAAVAFLAATPALSVAYALQGSVKEVGTAFGVVLVAALIPPFLATRGGPRRAMPLAVAAGATVAIVGPAAAVWIGPLMLGAFLAAARPWREALVFAAVVAVIGHQMLLDLVTYVDVAGGVVTAQQEFGNLLGPLDKLQAFGIWLTGDYRVPVTEHRTITRALIAVVALAAVAGLIQVARRRSWGLGLFLAVSALGFAFVIERGSPWADGKALMIVSPAVMLAAGLGAAWLGRAGWAVLAVIGLGVLWTNALQYHDAAPAPHDRFAELEQVGERVEGRGPTLYPEFEEFAKHFLRRGDPEGTGEGWQRRFSLSGGRDGSIPRFGFAQDLDFFEDQYVSYYRTIVLRKGFQSSRPPSTYRRTFDGDHYEVWERGSGDVIARLPAGGNRRPAAAADCGALEALAGRSGTLAYVERPANVILDVAKQQLPGGWFIDVADAETVVLRGAGTLRGAVEVPAAGRYDVWMEISDRRGWTVDVGGRRLEVSGELSSRGVAQRAGSVELPAGSAEIALTRPGGDLRPGSGGYMRLLGPVALTPADPGALPVRTIPANRWRTLCGRSVDWVEALS